MATSKTERQRGTRRAPVAAAVPSTATPVRKTRRQRPAAADVVPEQVKPKRVVAKQGKPSAGQSSRKAPRAMQTSAAVESAVPTRAPARVIEFRPAAGKSAVGRQTGRKLAAGAASVTRPESGRRKTEPAKVGRAKSATGAKRKTDPAREKPTGERRPATRVAPKAARKPAVAQSKRNDVRRAGATAARSAAPIGRAGRTAVATKPKGKATAKTARKRAATPALRLVGKNTAARGRPVAPPVRAVRIRELDPLAKCGANTSVQHLYRVDELTDGRAAIHLVFFDRHGWYCVHGKACAAVEDVRKHARIRA